MRGAAPSIVCPRCEQAAPPANALGQFTTCTKCGMTFDAAPRERLRSFRKRKHDPAPVRDEPDRPVVDEVVVEKPERKPGHLSGLQVVGILVAILAIGWIKVELFPSEEQLQQEHEIEAIQREARERASDARRLADRAAALQADAERRLREMNEAQRAALLESPIASCQRLGSLMRHVWACDDAGGRKQVEEHIGMVGFVLPRGEGDMATRCTTYADAIESNAKRLGCR